MSVSHWLLNKMFFERTHYTTSTKKECDAATSTVTWKDLLAIQLSGKILTSGFSSRSNFKSPSHQLKVQIQTINRWFKFKLSIKFNSLHNLGRHIITNVPGGEAISSLGSQPRSGRNDDRLGRGNPKQDQQVIWGWLNELMECIKITNRHQDIFRLTVNDTDIWFKTREMQQTDLGKQMVQLQKDIKQMSKVWCYDEK